ncbi:unnamed protein product [Rotaria socialis]
MNNTNDFHPSSSSMLNNGINETSKHLPNKNDTNIIAINKKLKSKSKSSPTLVTVVNEIQSIKGYNKRQKSINFKRKRLIHSDSNNSNSSTKLKSYSHSNLEYMSRNKKEARIHHSSKTNCCNSCNYCFGEIVSCKMCSATFHLDCMNPSLTKDDIPKDAYFCENCQTITKTQEDSMNKNKQQKIIQSFSFNPKKNLHEENSKKHHHYQSKLGQIKLPTASNGQSLVQPSGEMKFRTINNNNEKHKHFLLSSSNLKRKWIDSSSSMNFLINNRIGTSNNHLDTLHRLVLSSQTEEFHCPSSINDSIYNQDQNYCFTCRKSTALQGPSIHCDYCPLTYHLDCLTPPMTLLPLLNEKWMCPNHIEPLLDRYLAKKKKISTSERVKIYHQYPQNQQNIISQEFSHIKQTKEYVLSNTIKNHRLESVNISQIPKVIEDFYLKANVIQNNVSEMDVDNAKEEKHVQTSLLSNYTTDTYDPCIWDILQAIIDHIVNNNIYEISLIDRSLIENDDRTKSPLQNESNTFNTIDSLLQALNEPNYKLEQCTDHKLNSCDIPIITNNEEQQQQQIPTSSIDTFSHLIDLSQFRLSHAALIHLNSQNVIYIRKHIIWFGSSSLNDICLNDYHSPTCQFITERHACLYYDRKNNLFELLNYSEYGTSVNDLRYGLDIINDNNYNKQENDNLSKCSCLTQSVYKPSWDGPAQIEQGTVIKIGCHGFLFYRHIVR